MFKGNSRLARLHVAMRQLMYPPEFRIGEPLWTAELMNELGEALKRFAEEKSVEPSSDVFDEQIVAIGTKVWRLRNEMMKQIKGPEATSLRYAASYLNDLWEQLSDAGIEIRDHTGEGVPKTGVYMLKTIAHQPMHGIEHQHVIETLKPTIYFNQRILQVGEVIVGTPKPSNLVSPHRVRSS